MNIVCGIKPFLWIPTLLEYKSVLKRKSWNVNGHEMEYLTLGLLTDLYWLWVSLSFVSLSLFLPPHPLSRSLFILFYLFPSTPLPSSSLPLPLSLFLPFSLSPSYSLPLYSSPFTSCLILGKILTSLCLNSIICKMGITSEHTYKVDMNKMVPDTEQTLCYYLLLVLLNSPFLCGRNIFVHMVGFVFLSHLQVQN